MKKLAIFIGLVSVIVEFAAHAYKLHTARIEHEAALAKARPAATAEPTEPTKVETKKTADVPSAATETKAQEPLGTRAVYQPPQPKKAMPNLSNCAPTRTAVIHKVGYQPQQAQQPIWPTMPDWMQQASQQQQGQQWPGQQFYCAPNVPIAKTVPYQPVVYQPMVYHPAHYPTHHLPAMLLQQPVYHHQVHQLAQHQQHKR